jgi:ParB-like chromosome segregation protein Spo0J
MTVVMLAVAILLPDPKNPRQLKEGEDLQQLSLDIKRRGILVPLLVRREGENCVIIDGHRRHADRAGIPQDRHHVVDLTSVGRPLESQ